MNSVNLLFRASEAVLFLAVVSCAPARADWCHGGEVPSLEWLVDASNVVAAEVVDLPNDYDKYRVIDVLKRSKQFTIREGDVIDGKPLWRWTNGYWKQGEPIVLFLGDDTDTVRSVVHLTRPKEVWNEPEKTYLMVDKHGKRVPDRDDFMRRVQERIESAGASDNGVLPAREDGFEYFPKFTEIDSDSEYYSLRVPPDPCFREMLEKAATKYTQHSWAGSCVWAQSNLYNFYLDLTDEQRQEHRKKTVRDACEFARTLKLRDEKFFNVTNYCTYRSAHGWLGRVSPSGRYLALLAGDTVELRDLESGDALSMNDGSYPCRGRTESIVFAPNDEHFAHVQADGDVTLIDLMRMEVVHTFKFGWKPLPKMSAWRFAFSPDSRHLVLMMHVLQHVRGNALQIWDVDSGKSVYRQGHDWTIRCFIEGFRRDSSLVKVGVFDNPPKRDEVPRFQVWDLAGGQLTDEPTTGEWLLHRSPYESRIKLEREAGEASLRAESGDGRLQAEVVPGTPQRLVIREVESQQVARSVELNGMEPVRHVYFTDSGDAVLLVIFPYEARMFRVDAERPWPTWIDGCQ